MAVPARVPADDALPHPGAPPPGWWVFCDRLTPIETPIGVAQRGARLYGVCYTGGCKRSQQINQRELGLDGLAGLPLDRLQRMYRCARLDYSCGFAFRLDPPTPVLPLRELEGRAFVKVRLACETRDCPGKIETTATGMAHQLQARGVGGGATNVFDLPGLVSGPCKVCGKRAWRAEVVWPETSTLKFARMQREAVEAARVDRKGPAA